MQLLDIFPKNIVVDLPAQDLQSWILSHDCDEGTRLLLDATDGGTVSVSIHFLVELLKEAYRDRGVNHDLMYMVLSEVRVGLTNLQDKVYAMQQVLHASE